MTGEPDPDALDRADDALLGERDRAELLGSLEGVADDQLAREARDRALYGPGDDDLADAPDFVADYRDRHR